MLEQLIIPQKLNSGDKIAIVASSWGGPATFPDRVDYAIETIKNKFGLECVLMPFAKKSAVEIKQNPKARAEDLMNAFKNPEIKAIFSAIGGDDSIRMLPYIDFEVIKNNPKIFLGFSDSTITHLLCLKAGLRSYYGPAIMAGFVEKNHGLFEFMENSFRKSLMSNEIIGEIPENNEGWSCKYHNWSDIKLVEKTREIFNDTECKLISGTENAKGRLIGGCIDVLEFAKGTSIFPDLSYFNNAILFFETSEDNPDPTNVGFYLRNYAVMGALKNIKGILFGRPCNKDKGYWEELESVILTIMQEESIDVPVLTRLNFGHTDPQMIMPYGAMCEIDVKNKKISILENATS